MIIWLSKRNIIAKKALVVVVNCVLFFIFCYLLLYAEENSQPSLNKLINEK